MNYLDSTEYLTYGLDATTDQSWVTAASAIIDAHCRRVTLGVSQYEERLKMPPELNTVRVSYLPLVTVTPAATPIVSLQGRYGIPRRGEWPFPEMSLEFAWSSHCLDRGPRSIRRPLMFGPIAGSSLSR